MKAKKPRSGKAVRSAARTVRRLPRTKPTTGRRKTTSARPKVRATKTARQPRALARAKATITPKAKPLRKRVIPKARAKAAPGHVADEGPASQIVPPLQQAPGVVSPEQTIPPGEPPAEPLGEHTARTSSGRGVPEILLENDESVSPPMTGPGRKYAVGPTGATTHVRQEEAVLPEAYGTGKLLLTARDPHWLYVHWDLTPEQQRRYNALSTDHHLVVRVCPGTTGTQPMTDVHVHPESRHWFVHVDHAGTQYAARLGYYSPRHQWVTIATSPSTITPADKPSTDQTVRFATIPPHGRLARLAAAAKRAIPAKLAPLEATRERALAELVSVEPLQQDMPSSAEIPELVGHQGEQEIPFAPVGLEAPFAGPEEGVSSPMAGPEAQPSEFWFNINAELVLYGGTEPGATVTIGGRPIQLRPDGTFSFRFSLPDGDHAVTVSAISAQGDLRQAELKFTRHTAYQGEVGSAAQDPALEPPLPGAAS